MTVPSFFARLRAVADDLDKGLGDLTIRQNLLARTGGGSSSGPLGAEAAPAAEDALEEVAAMAGNAAVLRAEVAEGRETMQSFLADTSAQVRSMMETVGKYETWAAQYGYTPVFDLKLDLEEALKAPEMPDEGEERSQEDEVKSPNIMEAGLTKEALERLGYKFKTDGETEPKSGQQSIKRTIVDGKRATAPRVSRGQHKFDVSSVESPLSMGGRSSFNSPSCGNSFSTTTDDDTPRGIMKKPLAGRVDSARYETPQLRLQTPPVPKPRTLDQGHEASRIEFTPGLFARKQNSVGRCSAAASSSSSSNHRSTPLRREVAVKNVLSASTTKAAEEDVSPKMPDLHTVSLKGLIDEKSLARAAIEAVACSPCSTLMAVSLVDHDEDDDLPPTPDLKTMNLREVLRPKEKTPSSLLKNHLSSAAKSFMDELENRDPDDVTPDLPDFKDKFMRELATRSGMKKTSSAAAAAGGDLETPRFASKSMESPDKTPPPPVLSAISRGIFEKETFL